MLIRFRSNVIQTRPERHSLFGYVSNTNTHMTNDESLACCDTVVKIHEFWNYCNLKSYSKIPYFETIKFCTFNCTRQSNCTSSR